MEPCTQVIRLCSGTMRRSKRIIVLTVLLCLFLLIQTIISHYRASPKSEDKTFKKSNLFVKSANNINQQGFGDAPLGYDGNYDDYKVDRHVLSHNQHRSFENTGQYFGDEQESLKAPKLDVKHQDDDIRREKQPVAPTVPKHNDDNNYYTSIKAQKNDVKGKLESDDVYSNNKIKNKLKFYRWDNYDSAYDKGKNEPYVNNKKPLKKVKQWESYDYDNPYNLLEIHVDRAAEHSEASGQPWPMPQDYSTSYVTYPVDMDNFVIRAPSQTCDRIDRVIERYTSLIRSKVDLYIPDGERLFKSKNAKRIISSLSVELTRPCQDSDLPHEHMSEQYKLSVTEAGATLSAQEPWGIIRGLETFSQLIYYNQGYAVINSTYIKDYPRFRFRGLMMDTARHFIPVKHIKRTMDAMSFNKMNVFHWHMADDQSFPFVSRTYPRLSLEGAYSAKEVYTPKEVANIVQYAADRAIRVIPELDTPGHTRSWGLGYPQLLTNCSASYFPFGAINPIQDYSYKFMSKLWAELHEVFPDNYVHVGGDEINYKCWLRVQAIRDFMIAHNMTKDMYDFETLDGDSLQGYYLKRLLEVMPKDRKKIAWEEAFVAAQVHNVSTDELIINVWKGGDFEWQYTIENVIRRGYKAIMSACWYLNYISYGRDWTKYYECDPHSFLMYAQGTETFKDLVLGGQVCIWAEFIDKTNLEATLWPRAIAPAEKLWSSVAQNDWRAAEARFEQQRCRMIRRGINAQPNSGPGSCNGRMKIKPPFDGEK